MQKRDDTCGAVSRIHEGKGEDMGLLFPPCDSFPGLAGESHAARKTLTVPLFSGKGSLVRREGLTLRPYVCLRGAVVSVSGHESADPTQVFIPPLSGWSINGYLGQPREG